MKRWLKLEMLPLILLVALHAKVFAVADLTPVQAMLAAAAFLIIPALAGAFYGYTVGREQPLKDTSSRWEVVDTTGGQS